ncbi:hypothetical protein VNO77_26686 [Canavalia gladiata]|uniref:Photosystem II 5 kDa protein, chloroplastic n=1 Tax=Canavalia gladiata TaxID=3824 RepID=A0AAN9KU09_CANGL
MKHLHAPGPLGSIILSIIQRGNNSLEAARRLVQNLDYIAQMASFTMTASIPGCPTVTNRSAVATQRRLVVNAARTVEGENVSYDNDKVSNGRRNLMFAAATAAVCSVARMAMADEPKQGTPEAKKKYAPVCVTMPTARICHK